MHCGEKQSVGPNEMLRGRVLLLGVRYESVLLLPLPEDTIDHPRGRSQAPSLGVGGGKDGRWTRKKMIKVAMRRRRVKSVTENSRGERRERRLRGRDMRRRRGGRGREGGGV
jgi:hypothetical protein